jgi:3-phenylpropionate/trans-cinnamate dioxygenase ferredoxin subunit
MKAGDLKDGAMKKVSVGGRDVLMVRIGGRYYGLDSKCPHLGGDLSKGSLDGTVLTCPVHGSQFDVTDGRALRWTDWTGLKLGLAKTLKAPRGLKTYDVKVEGDRVLIALK